MYLFKNYLYRALGPNLNEIWAFLYLGPKTYLAMPTGVDLGFILDGEGL